MHRRAATAAIALAVVAGTGAATAAVAQMRVTTYRASRSCSVAAGATRRCTVGYPHALEWGDAAYSQWFVMKTGRHAGAAKVTLSPGMSLGGSQYQVVIHNGSPAGVGAITITVTAQTRH